MCHDMALALSFAFAFAFPADFGFAAAFSFGWAFAFGFRVARGGVGLKDELGMAFKTRFLAPMVPKLLATASTQQGSTHY